MEHIADDRRVVANIQRLYEGDCVLGEWIGTEKQVMTRIYLVCDAKQALADTLKEYMAKIKVYDSEGNQMALHGFDVDAALELRQ